MSETVMDKVGVEDVMPVGSRVSWGAIVAGGVIALAVYLVLTLLGGAIGLSIDDSVSAQTLGTGAAIWAIATTIIALFAGGWVTSQCVVGESKGEGILHGVIMWGLVLFMTLWLVSAGMRAGFSAMWGLASFTTNAAQATDVSWTEAAHRAGVSQTTINEWQQEARTAPAEARQATDPATLQTVDRYATSATWYTLLGTLLSMAAAIGGAYLGAGPTFHLLTVRSYPGRQYSTPRV